MPRIDTRPDAVTQALLRALADDLHGCTDDAWRFFATLVSAHPPYKTTTSLAHDLAVTVSTLEMRFCRAGLPHVRRYLCAVVGVRLAGLLEKPSMTLAGACTAVGIHGFNYDRWCVNAFGCRVRELRARETGASMIDRLRAELVRPYVDVFAAIEPLRWRPQGFQRKAVA